MADDQIDWIAQARSIAHALPITDMGSAIGIETISAELADAYRRGCQTAIQDAIAPVYGRQLADFGDDISVALAIELVEAEAKLKRMSSDAPAQYRAGMEAAERIVREGQQTYSNRQPFRSLTPRSRIRAAIDALPEGGDGWQPTFTALRNANSERQAQWCPEQVPDLSFRGNELAGEVGEACNVIKKLERERQGWRGSRATSDQLADELADVVICADLTAIQIGVDLGDAVVRKFNATSVKHDLSTRLGPLPAPPPGGAK